MNLHEYLAKAHGDLSDELRNMIADVINGINTLHPGLERDARAKKWLFLREALRDMNFTEEEIEAFAAGSIPEEKTKYVNIPVDLEVSRWYRIWVRVPEEAGRAEVVEAAQKHIQNVGVSDEDLDISQEDISEDDVLAMDIDWAGAYSCDCE